MKKPAYAIAIGAAVLDAWTTTTMMASGSFEEANTSAATLMNHLGTNTWTALASIIYLLLTTTLLLRPDTLLKKSLISYGLIITAIKLNAGITNLTLYYQTSH